MNDSTPPVGESDNIEKRISEILHSLQASRRRRVIQLMRTAGRPVSTRELARQIAAIENGLEPAQVDSRQYKNVYNALSQSHLPTLFKANIIVYDPQRQTASNGHLFALATLLLNLNQPAVEAFYEGLADGHKL